MRASKHLRTAKKSSGKNYLLYNIFSRFKLRKAIHFIMFRTPWNIQLSMWPTSQLLCQHNTTTLQFTREKCMVTWNFTIGKLRCRRGFTIYEEFTLICDENLELAAKTMTNENRWHQSKQNTNFFFEKSHQENGTTINFSSSVSHENFPVDRPKRPFSICTKKAKEYSDIFWN